MELRQLRYFVVVARERHFGRAARLLRVAQPALSRQIQKLEHEIGFALFTRHARGASLTPEATRFLDGVQRILSDLNELTDDLSKSDAIPRGKVTIGLSSATADILAAPLTTRVAGSSAEVRLSFRTAHMATRLELTLQQRIDIAIVDMLRGLPGLSVSPLWREPLCILCRKDDTRFTQQLLELRDLAGIPLVNGFPDTGPRRVLDEALERVGLHNTPIVEVDAFSTSKRMMLAGHAPTVNTPAIVAAELRAGLVRAIPIRGLYLARAVALSEERPVSPAVRLVAEQITVCAREMIALGEWPLAEALDHDGNPVVAKRAKQPRAGQSHLRATRRHTARL